MKKAVKLILIFVFLLYAFRLMGGMFFFSPFSIFGSRENSGIISDDRIKNGEIADYKNIHQKIEDKDIPDAKVVYNPVSQETINFHMDCNKSDSIPAKYRKDKMLCRNIYATSIDELKTAREKEKPARIVLYGRHVIYNCPAFPQKQISDLVEGCFLSARFLDNVQLPKMAQILSVKLPKKQLYVHFDEDNEEIVKFCRLKNEEVAACFNNAREIHLPLGNSYDDKFYPQGAPVYAGGTKGRSDSRTYYTFNVIYPRGCYIPIHTSHEVMHYFDFIDYGNAPSWFKETMAMLISSRMTDALCPPGVGYRNVVKSEDGKIKLVDNFDFDSEEYRLFEVYNYWKDDACHKAFILTLNNLLNTQGLSYLPKLYSALASKVAYDYYREIPVKSLTHAVIESAGNDPEIKKFMVAENKCPY